MTPGQLKSALYAFCKDYLQQREDGIKEAISMAQSGANNETKSTAGDKHETSKAMMQQEVERLSDQLAEVSVAKEELKRIKPSVSSPVVIPGSLVITSNGNYYVAIGAGKTEIENKTYFTVSLASPIGLALKGLKEGSIFNFNGMRIKIIELH